MPVDILTIHKIRKTGAAKDANHVQKVSVEHPIVHGLKIGASSSNGTGVPLSRTMVKSEHHLHKLDA